MIKKTVTYTDFFGMERTEDFRFHLSKAELVSMNMKEHGALEEKLERIVKAKNAAEIMENFRNLLRMSYGVISDDGRRFIKSEELSDAFEQTEAYSQIFMELCTDPKACSAFASGVIPQDLAEAIKVENESANKNANNVVALPLDQKTE